MALTRPPLALCYHGVADVPLLQDRSRLFVRPEDLRHQIDTLRRWGYRLVTFGELALRARDREADGLAALTFDDGLVDNCTVLAPLLAAASIPATLFVVTEWLGRPHPDAPWTRVMTAEELRRLSQAGIEVGGHSTRHDHLPDLGPGAAEGDMRRCRSVLEAMLDRPVTVFAYPYGGATDETIAACAAAGYRAACRSAGAGDWHQPLNLPRQDMQNRDSALGLWLKRHGRYEPVVRTRPGMAARRALRLARWIGEGPSAWRPQPRSSASRSAPVGAASSGGQAAPEDGACSGTPSVRQG